MKDEVALKSTTVSRNERGVGTPPSPTLLQSPNHSVARVPDQPDSPCSNTDGDFQCFVRETVIEICIGREEIHKQINNMESNINDSIQFESRCISKLENQWKCWKTGFNRLMNQQFMSHIKNSLTN